MSGNIQGYQDLTAWQTAMDLVEAVYRVTHMWPKEELYGLTNQARRAAVSVPANIAEGKGRQGAAEFAHHLSMAMGSLHEAETHLLIARRLGYSSADDTARLLAQSGEVGRLIGGLMRSLRAAQS
jgi:four helix bundle protein